MPHRGVRGIARGVDRRQPIPRTDCHQLPSRQRGDLLRRAAGEMEQHRESESGQRRGRLGAGPPDLHPSGYPLQQPILHRRVTHRQVASCAGGHALRDSSQEIVNAIGAVHPRCGNIDPSSSKEPVRERLIERDHSIEIGGETTRDTDITAPRLLGAQLRPLQHRVEALAPCLLGHVSGDPTPRAPRRK